MNLPSKVYHRLRRESKNAVAFIGASCFGTQCTPDQFIRHIEFGPDSDASWNRVVTTIRSNPIPFFTPDGLASLRDPDANAQAQSILQHQITLYGSPVRLDTPARWMRDPLTHATWPADIHFSRYKVFHPSNDGRTDIRRLWELGRFGWALPLAQRGDTPAFECWCHHIDSFLQSHLPEYGPHWLNAMEVALRLLNWIRALDLFQRSPVLHLDETHIIWPKLLPAFLAHGRYIRRHLEWTPRGRTNHYLSNCVGLLGLSLYLPMLKESKEWKSFAVSELEKEMEIQTDADAFHSEASTAYHRFVLEMYLMTAHWEKSHAVGFSSRYLGRIREMIQVDFALRGNENLDPRIGDDDSSTLFPESLRRAPYTLGSWFPWEMKTPSRHSSFALFQSGIHVLKSQRIICHVSCGTNGQEGVGGHAHNDKLSLTLRLDGIPILMDPGTGHYSGNLKLRDHFRSTASHNTIQINEMEQNPLIDWRKLDDTTQCRILEWSVSDSVTLFKGSHRGFSIPGLTCTRRIQLDHQSHLLEISDHWSSGNRVMLHLHLDSAFPRDQIRVEAQEVKLPIGTFSFQQAVDIQLTESFCSPVYGQTVMHPHLKITVRQPEQGVLEWKFQPTGSAISG